MILRFNVPLKREPARFRLLCKFEQSFAACGSCRRQPVRLRTQGRAAARAPAFVYPSTISGLRDARPYRVGAMFGVRAGATRALGLRETLLMSCFNGE